MLTVPVPKDELPHYRLTRLEDEQKRLAVLIDLLVGEVRRLQNIVEQMGPPFE
jgi:hypothetical protein